jgi:hypothetical protein
MAAEMGLLKSLRIHNRNHPLETTVAVAVVLPGHTSDPRRDAGKGARTPSKDDLAVLAAENRSRLDDRQPEQGFHTRSDHFPFVRVDTLDDLARRGLRAASGEQGGLDRKFGTDYHKPSDEWSADWIFVRSRT